VLARFVHHDRLIDNPGAQTFAALTTSPGARAYYDQLRVRDISHHAAIRELANRLVGILHGRLKNGTLYDEATLAATIRDARRLTFKLLGCLFARHLSVSRDMIHRFMAKNPIPRS